MTATNHALTGAVIALAVKNPALAIPLAFASHFATDALPHFGIHIKDVFKRNHSKQFRIVLITDLILASLLGLSILTFLGSKTSNLELAACMFAAVSPDLVWGIRFFKEIIRKAYKPPQEWFSKFHLWIQWSETPYGIIVELLWFGVMLTALLSLR